MVLYKFLECFQTASRVLDSRSQLLIVPGEEPPILGDGRTAPA